MKKHYNRVLAAWLFAGMCLVFVGTMVSLQREARAQNKPVITFNDASMEMSKAPASACKDMKVLEPVEISGVYTDQKTGLEKLSWSLTKKDKSQVQGSLILPLGWLAVTPYAVESRDTHPDFYQIKYCDDEVVAIKVLWPKHKGKKH